MRFCVELARAPENDARIGGKARSLRRLAAAGLPVPPALVVTADLFHALRAGGPELPAALADEAALAATARAAEALRAAPWPAGFEDELAAGLAQLGTEGPFSVRSSATLEDRAGALGAGLFLSRTGLAAGDVAGAVRDVLAAALAPAALAYAARRGLGVAELAMAVLVHPFTPGEASGTAAFDGSGEPLVEATRGALAPAARARVVAAARALARGGGVELEWVATGDAALFLQARPWRAPARRPWSHAAELADAAWTWDAAHNPLPLSPAQAGLVALVDERCRTPFRQRVAGGYLFYGPSSAGLAEPRDASNALIAAETLAQMRLRALEASPTLEDALRVFVEIYEALFGVVQPAARAARDALAAHLRARGADDRLGALLAGTPSLATERARRAAAIASTHEPAERAAGIAAYLAVFGDEAPVWDVAVPTYAEDPSPLHRLVAAPSPSAAGEAAVPALPLEGQALLAAARRAAAVAEDDDVLYARVQGRVRRTLLAEGRRLQSENLLARAEDVFWLPLETVRRSARGEEPLTLAAVTHAIAAARDAHAAALADPPPLGAAPSVREGGVRGRCGSPGRALGRVHVHDPAIAVPAGAILVARTLLPTELPLLAPAAIVVETGGVLGHVAAQARERGVPAIVDAPGAASAFREGDQVLVDADAGLAVRVGD
jgi:phosphohistidine swiveling domain-containing protein